MTEEPPPPLNSICGIAQLRMLHNTEGGWDGNKAFCESEWQYSPQLQTLANSNKLASQLFLTNFILEFLLNAT